MKEFSIKRFTASLLFIVMVVAALPASLFGFTIGAAAAEEKTVYVLAGSDFQAESDSEGQTNVRNILAQIQKDYPTMDGFLFAGDYTANLLYNVSDTTSGKNALQKTIRDAYGDNLHEIYVQGNHDLDKTVDEVLSSSGDHDTADYGVYVINEMDYMWFNNEKDTIKATAENLKAYLDAKRDARYTKPVFVVSHLPLHYSMRTLRDGDGMYANYIFEVLNNAGEDGLNIIFLFGHNHSHGWDDYLGGSSIFLTKGDKINIAQESRTNFIIETLNFTYMNAGYVGYYGETGSGADSTLTMTTFAITGNEVVISRYDENGNHLLKSEGKYGCEYYTNEGTYYDADPSTTASLKTITLAQFDNNTGSSGTTDPDQGSLGSDSSSGTVNGPTVDASGGNWVLIKDAVAGETKYVYEPATSITTNRSYVILAGNQTVALKNNNGSFGSVTSGLEIKDNSKLYSDTKLDEWTFSGNSSGTIKNGDDYFRLSERSCSLTNGSNQASTLNFTKVSDATNSYRIERRRNNSNNYYFYYTGSSWSSSTNTQTVRLYSYSTVETTDSTPAEYAIAEGGLEYTLERGATSDDAIAAVKNGISVYNSIDEKATKTLVSDSEVTFALADNFDGNSAGEYAVTITYGDKTLATAKVIIPEKAISNVKLSTDAEGTVLRGAKPSDYTGAKLIVTYVDGESKEVFVTVGMLTTADGEAVSTKDIGTLPGLKLTYNNSTVTKDFTLNVIAKEGNNYPEYPNEGAVKVSKTAIYEDEKYRQTGVAQVELSVSGIPSKKGSDVIVMLDNSSSMTSNMVNDKTRLDVLKESLANMLEQFQAVGEDGTRPDIRIAVANFNGYYPSGSRYYVEPTDHLAGCAVQPANDPTHDVYTGSCALDAEAFVDVNTLSATAFNSIGYDNGTNYDYAFDAVYQLGEAITAKNAKEGVERDLFVIFMSDGAPFQYNYFQSRSGYDNLITEASYWNNWLTGTVEPEKMFDKDANNDYYNPEGKHWMAEAIKGDPTKTYPVIRKNDPTDENGDNWVDVYGLGAKMYSIGFCLAVDKEITVDSMETVIRNIASSDDYYYRADSADKLNTAFSAITSDILYAATNAYFVDKMGEAFDLQLEHSVTRTVDGKEYTLTVEPTITVKSYEIYTRSDWEKEDCEDYQIGTRKKDDDGHYLVTVLETVTFNSEGSEAYSSSDGYEKNILIDNVIYASTFTYNNNKDGTSVPITALDGKKLMLGAETFYWKVGTVQSSELAISYYVYLTDTLEGQREAGSYATNESAILYYENYLGNLCQKATVSPMLAWNAANVSYAFYLVDEDGKVITSRKGDIGNFADKIVITRPVMAGTIKLNTASEVSALDIVATNVLPEGYELYDKDATYTVVVLSDKDDEKMGWVIEKSEALKTTTYVTGYTTGNEYTNEVSVHVTGYDYTHTTVWFAVVWKHSTIQDQVVIDYGVPVDISALANDLFDIDKAKLNGVGAEDKIPTLNDSGYTENPSKNFNNEFVSTYGTATINISNGKIRYTPQDMQMDSYDRFAYEVEFAVDGKKQYYYGIVTVIPATTIYYEESFVTFEDAKNEDGTYGKWTVDGTTNSGAIQAEDRPGKQSLAEIDHDNLYGYDDINASATTFSLGAAKKVTVNSQVGNHKENSPTATFTFTGTGFDIISMTNSDSGAIFITAEKEVEGDEDEYTVNKFIDNYYGYTYDQDSDVWTPTSDSEAAVYQVPVMKIADLPYDTYKVTIWVTYGELFDHNDDDEYSFWLDSIRIYDPAGNVYDGKDNTIANAYKDDGEAYPKYLRIKDAILDPGNIKEGNLLPGAVFIDGCESTDDVALYKNPGPNNEAYLAPGQSISFKLKANAKPVDVQLGAKLAFGESVDLELSYTINGNTLKRQRTISTATDMYYTIMQYLTDTVPSDGWETGTITITNVSDEDVNAVASLTNIKETFESDTVMGGSTSKPVQSFMLVDDQVVEDAIAVMRELYAPKPTVFTPEVLEYTVTRGLFGYYTVNVITSKDVASLTVNGQAAKLVNDSLIFGTLIKLVDNIIDKSTVSNYNIWTVTLKGTSEYDIVAIDENGLSSDPQAAASGSSIDREDIMNYIQSSELYRIMKELAAKRFDPESFEAYVNERLDGLREIITKTSEDVEYVIIDGRIVDRYITETIIDTATGEETVRRIWIAEPAEGSDEVEVNAYNENGIGSASKWASFGFMPSAESGKSFSELFGKM